MVESNAVFKTMTLRHSVTSSATECLISQFNALQVVTSIIKQAVEQISRVACVSWPSLPVFLSMGYWTRWNSVIIPPLPSPCFTMQTKPGACRHVAHAITRQTKKSEFASSPTSTAGRLRVGASPQPAI